MTNKYIESAWINYRAMIVPADAGDVQVNETRQAFYAGAACLFQTIMVMLDPGTAPTDADMQRMSDVQTELDAFGQEIDRKVLNLPQH